MLSLVLALALQEDFDKLWNYGDPAGTEQKFRAVQAQLLTQIARCQGLQGKFEDAHKTLDEAEKLDAGDLAKTRLLLERGRVWNSSGNKDKAKPLFEEAYRVASKIREDFHACDALHMLGIVSEPKAALEWNAKAIALAEASPKAKNWLGPLYNNTGWTHHDLGEYEKALEFFKKALAVYEELKRPGAVLYAKYSVGRALRLLGRLDEALRLQQSLDPKDGYVCEEIGECLLAQGKKADAKPWFGKAYDELSKDEWLVANEPRRLARLKELSGK